MNPHIKKAERHKECSERAAELERNQQWQQAADAWNLAARAALNERNRQWCESRCAFCERMKIRPFRGEE